MHVGILWDIENVTPPANTNYIQSVIEKVGENNRISYAMAFGDWNKNSIKNIAHELSVNNFELIHIPKSRKDSADMSLVAHGVELIFQYPHIERFVLISGDGDFRPLLSSQKKWGKETWVICDVKKHASEDLLKMADKYLDYREIINPEDNQESDITQISSILTKEMAFELFKEAVGIIIKEGKKPLSSYVKIKMKLLNNEFDEKKWGYNSWLDFVKEAKTATNITFENGCFAINDKEETIPEVFKMLIQAIKETDKLELASQVAEKFDYKKYGYKKFRILALDAEKRGYIETMYDADKTTWFIKKK
ncbi:MAG: NYN domain-containing protein [Treponema sp.]|nr:NYN domain-containing protein [Treponema sp.]